MEVNKEHGHKKHYLKMFKNLLLYLFYVFLVLFRSKEQFSYFFKNWYGLINVVYKRESLEKKVFFSLLQLQIIKYAYMIENNTLFRVRVATLMTTDY